MSNYSLGLQDSVDKRVRLRPRVSQANEIYGSSPILQLLRESNGMVFPYTPTISIQHQVDYQELRFAHSNQDFNFFNRNPSNTFTIYGKFTAQNKKEAQYTFACFHFLRVITKMHFGKNDPRAGLPPPSLVLDGYGDYMWNSLPVIITQYGIEMPPNVDYVRASYEGAQQYGLSNPVQNEAWVPTECNISITAVVQNVPKRLKDEFNLDQFRNGQLLGTRGKGWW